MGQCKNPLLLIKYLEIWDWDVLYLLYREDAYHDPCTQGAFYFICKKKKNRIYVP